MAFKNHRTISSFSTILTISLVITLTGFAVFVASVQFRPASAHISKVFGNTTVEVGWNNEPALTGQMNAVQLTIFTGTSAKPQPVLNAVANLEITAQYGTTTKKLDFVPSGTVDGQYLASIIPTREGTYTLLIKGAVNGQNIDTQINLDDVASSDTLNFPPSSGGTIGSGGSGNGTVSPAIISQLGGVINQLTGDVDSAKKSADTAAQNSANAEKSATDAKNSADRSFMIGLTAIGVGAAGIAIAVAALNRRESKLLQR
jgi:hypothetical protein